MSELSKEQVERAIGSIGRRDYRDPHIQKIAREAMKRKKKKEKPTPPVSKPTPSRPSSSSSRSRSRHSGGGSSSSSSHHSGGSSSSSSSSSKYYYIRPGTYEGVTGMISSRSSLPSGRGWKRVSKEEYEEHKRKAREYHERKEKEKLERRIRHGDKTALKEWEKRYGKPEVTGIVTTKNPKTGERVEIPVARTPYGTYIYEIGGKVKELKPAIGKREESVLGDIAREYHKSVIGKSPKYAVSYGSVKKQEFGRYAVAEAYADIKRGRKQAWKTPDDKLIVVEGTSPPYGMSKKEAKERGFQKLKPEEVKLEGGKLYGLLLPAGISKTPTIKPEAVKGGKMVTMKAGATSIVGVPTGEEALMGQGTRQPKESELSPFHQSVIEEQKKLNEWEEMRARWRGILEREKQKEQVTREFEQMDTYPKRWVSFAIGLKNIPDLAELTWLKATGQTKRWREKRAEMLLEFKEMGQKIVKKPAEGVPSALVETFTEGAGQLPLYAGIGRVTMPLVGKYLSEATKAGVKTGAIAKGVVYGMGVTAVAIPSIDVTMEGIRGNMRNVVRKSAQYATEFGAFTLGAMSSMPWLRAEISSEKIGGRFIKKMKSRETPFSLFKSKIKAFRETKTGPKSLELKPKSVVELKPTMTRELVNAQGKTIGEISGGRIKFSASEIESPITGRFVSISKSGKTKGFIEIPEQKIGAIKIKRQLINLKSEDLLSLEKRGLIKHIKGEIPEPIISREGKIIGAEMKRGEATVQPFAREGIIKSSQVRRIQKTEGRIDITKNIDDQFFKVFKESNRAYIEAGKVVKVSPKKSYARVKGITSEGVKYKVAEVRTREPVENYLDKHLVRIREGMNDIYKDITGERIGSSKNIGNNVDNAYKNIANEMKLPESKAGIVEKVSKLKLKTEKVPEKQSLTEKLWEKRRRLTSKVKERLPEREEERFWRERRIITETRAKRKLKLKGVEKAGVSASLTPLLHRINKAQRQIIEPLIERPEQSELPKRKQIPYTASDILKRIDQQIRITQQTTQQIEMPPLPPPPRIFQYEPELPPPPKPPKPPKKGGGGGIIPLGMPFAGIGLGAIDSQYRTVTKHIKHSIPKVEKLLEL